MGLFPKDTFVVIYNDESEAITDNLHALHLGVYNIIYRHRNNTTGQCNPSQDLLAKEAHLTRKTLSKVIDELVELGVLYYDKEEKTGTGHSRNYRFPYVEKRLAKEKQDAPVEEKTSVRAFTDKFVVAANDDSRKAIMIALVNHRTKEDAKADVDLFWYEMHQRWAGTKSKLAVFDILDKLKMGEYKKLFDDYD